MLSGYMTGPRMCGNTTDSLRTQADGRVVVAWTWRKQKLTPFQLTPHNAQATQKKKQSALSIPFEDGA
jgi:hypothetical protein